MAIFKFLVYSKSLRSDFRTRQGICAQWTLLCWVAAECSTKEAEIVSVGMERSQTSYGWVDLDLAMFLWGTKLRWDRIRETSLCFNWTLFFTNWNYEIVVLTQKILLSAWDSFEATTFLSCFDLIVKTSHSVEFEVNIYIAYAGVIN